MRVVRDIFSEHFERAIVDDPKQHQRLVSFFTRTAPELVDRVELYEEKAPLFAAYGVDKVIDGLMTRRVDLPSGGYLIIDYAEALTVIDVNSGSFIGRGKGARLEDTITTTNLEAAEEVVNQLRLRDIGGIIVIDFIDMARARNRDAVLKTLRKTLDEDRTKTFTAEISKLGLVEMTRQNVTEGVREIISRPCPTCNGDGVIKSEETIAIEFERRLRVIAKKAPKKHEAFLVQMNPRVSAVFTGNAKRVLHTLEEETGRRFHFTGTEGLPLDHFDILMEGSKEDVMERAVPFREGDEVLVHIVEPHMYDVDDAVAKIDGYIISVAGGGRFVGAKRLVRIDHAGRTSATATMLDAPRRRSRPRRWRRPSRPKLSRVARSRFAAAAAAVAGDARGLRRAASRVSRRPRRAEPGSISGQQSVATSSARQSSASLAGPRRVMRSVSSAFGTTPMLSRLSAHSSGIPSSAPSRTSVAMPRMRVVAGATSTPVRTAIAAWRVRMHAGRRPLCGCSIHQISPRFMPVALAGAAVRRGHGHGSASIIARAVSSAPSRSSCGRSVYDATICRSISASRSVARKPASASRISSERDLPSRATRASSWASSSSDSCTRVWARAMGR